MERSIKEWTIKIYTAKGKYEVPLGHVSFREWGDPVLEADRTNVMGGFGDLVGPMFDGEYMEVAGVRYRLHNRFETPEVYDALSE